MTCYCVYMLNHNAFTSEILTSMRGAIAKVVAHTQPEMIDDLLNTAIVKALEGTFDATRANLKTWASTIAYNEACNWAKRAANNGHVSETAGTEDSEPAPLVDTLVGEDGRAHALRVEQAQWLAMALDTLTREERTFILAISDGMGQTEAGALVGWSPATATRRRREIAAKMRAL